MLCADVEVRSRTDCEIACAQFMLLLLFVVDCWHVWHCCEARQRGATSGANVLFGAMFSMGERARRYTLWVAEDAMTLTIGKPMGFVLFPRSEF